MKYLGKKHLRRTWRWEGFVEEASLVSLWLRLIPTDHKGPERSVEIDRSYGSNLQIGEFVTLCIRRIGRRRHVILRPKRLKRWTQAELDTIKERAQETARHLAWLTA